MKKIAFIIAHLGNGGAERVSTELANQMKTVGYDVLSIIFSDKYKEYKLDDEIRTYYLDSYIDQKSRLKALKKAMQMKRIINEEKPDCIIELGFASRYLSVTGIAKKYKVITSYRNDPRSYDQKGIVTRFWNVIRDSYFEDVYAMVFQTEYAKSCFNKKIQAKSVVIPNPMKGDLPERFEGVRDKRIVAYSRLNKQKNLPMLLRCFKRFSERYPEYRLEIYGRGEEQEALIAMSQKLGIENKVFFKGFCSNVHEQIRNAAMYISTSDYEGISNSMLEALGIGLPCICTDCPVYGARMVIKDGVNGILIPVSDEDRLLQNMEKLANDKAFAEKLSKNATKLKNQLGIQTITKQWMQLIENEEVGKCNE